MLTLPRPGAVMQTQPDNMNGRIQHPSDQAIVTTSVTIFFHAYLSGASLGAVCRLRASLIWASPDSRLLTLWGCRAIVCFDVMC